MQEIKQEKSPIKINILQYLDLMNISAYRFYKDSGITRGVLSQNNGMSEENIAKFLAYAPDVNETWLLTGKGPMLRNEARPKDEEPADQDAAASDELLDRIEQQAQEIARLQGRIEAQKDFIELIISKLSKNNGGGNFGFPAIGLENSPIDLTNPSQDQADPR